LLFCIVIIVVIVYFDGGICVRNRPGSNLEKVAQNGLNLSTRPYDRILKVSRNIADLSGSDDIKPEHLAEAIQYRSLDREGWAG
jgi:magnesium chelatase family protein